VLYRNKKGDQVKKYTFTVDGHEDDYFRVFDVKRLFAGLIYREDVRRAVEYVKAEIAMRRIVFRNDTVKCRQKVAEMEHVLKVLSRYSDRFPEMQKEIFE